MFFIYRWLYRQFALSRAQSNGLLILFPLCLIFVFSEPAWRFIRSGNQGDFTSESIYLDSLMEVLFVTPPVEEPELFEFDPNSASIDDLQRLGFTPNVARRIISYTGKGGRFRSPEDLFRIYGVDSIQIQQVIPWVRIPDEKRGPKTWNKTERKKSAATVQRQEPFDLNAADTIQLKRIKGIGSKLSQRIIRYRESLGGFYSPNQLYEVFKLDSAVVQELQNMSFISPEFKPRQISINTAEQPELANHPYLTPREAAVIVAYRFTHGKYATVKDLEKIGGLDSLRLSRVRPYLSVD